MNEEGEIICLNFNIKNGFCRMMGVKAVRCSKQCYWHNGIKN